MHEVEVLVLQLLGFCLTLSPECNLLSQQTEMWIVTQKSQHNQIGIETVKAVSNVRIVIRLGFCQSDVFHDLVLPFSRNFVT